MHQGGGDDHVIEVKSRRQSPAFAIMLRGDEPRQPCPGRCLDLTGHDTILCQHTRIDVYAETLGAAFELVMRKIDDGKADLVAVDRIDCGVGQESTYHTGMRRPHPLHPRR